LEKYLIPSLLLSSPGKEPGWDSNGIIRIESDIDIGTTFHIFFPRTEIEHVIVPGKNENIPVGSETILLVDDDDTFLDVGGRMLERLGYEVFTATSGVEVLDMFEKNPERYDLVIVDMTMPEMNGLELSKKLLEIYEDIPIIICTGHNDLISSKISRDIAIRDYVMKPFVRYELASIIRGVLD
jgi:two-component system, cell cycle sensor histidine kinase and response regulator CckA